MPKNKVEYGNESISQLKGADRVRKRPGVIFGSDGLDGCEHSVFEIISNSIDEAREGYGNKVVVTKYADGSIEVQDFGRGAPVDFNNKEQRFNWELLYCEMYAGGKYDTNDGANYEYSVGLNGLGLCSTQYASEYMDGEIKRDGFKYNLHFEKGYNGGGLKNFNLFSTSFKLSLSKTISIQVIKESLPSLYTESKYLNNLLSKDKIYSTTSSIYTLLLK